MILPLPPSRFVISDRSGLAPGNILLIDADEPDLAEFIAIENLTTTAPADQPAAVTLDYPVIFSHRRGAIVRQVNPQPQGASQTLAVEAWAGDACVFLDALGAVWPARRKSKLPAGRGRMSITR